MSLKHALLTSVAIFALSAGTALAQTNTSTVNQSGTSNSATIDQTGQSGGGNATSTVNQAGNAGTVDVTQSGQATNTSTVNQDDSLVNTLNPALNLSSAQITQSGTAGSNTAIVNQGGSNPTAMVNQTSDAAGTGNYVTGQVGNYASIDQANHVNEGSDTWVEGLVNQSGTDNSANITQLQSYVQLTSTPDGQINQTGSQNYGSIYQDAGSYRPTASITQNGNYNDGATYQDGANGQATINQTSNSNTAFIGQYYGSSNETASVTQGNGTAGTNNNGGSSAFVYQGGTGDSITIGQSGQYNFANTNQYGSNGQAAITQDSSGGNGGGNSTGVGQFGSGDQSTVSQTGSYNNGYITQGNYYYGGSTKDTATITQNGNNYSSAYIDQGDAYNGGLNGNASSNSQATITQDSTSGNGGGNYGSISQNGSTDIASISQTGSNVTLNYVGYNTGNYNYYNVDGIQQYGNNEQAYITQTGVGNGYGTYVNNGTTLYSTGIIQAGNGDYAAILENGSGNNVTGNNSTILQNFNDQGANGTAGGNTAYSYQGYYSTPSNALSVITQDGSSNTALVDQESGNNLSSNVTQNGTGNLAEVFQYISNSTSNVTQSGSNNQAWVYQTGVGGMSTITQAGSGNIATIHQ